MITAKNQRIGSSKVKKNWTNPIKIYKDAQNKIKSIQINKISFEKGDIIINNNETQKLVKAHFENILTIN